MEEFFFIVAMLSFAGAIIILTTNILNNGIKGIFSTGRKSSKWMTILFSLYMICFIIYLSISK